jgi:hypothetical protein
LEECVAERCCLRRASGDGQARLRGEPLADEGRRGAPADDDELADRLSRRELRHDVSDGRSHRLDYRLATTVMLYA